MRVLLWALSVLAVSVAWATDYTWNGSTGSFQTDSNWSPTGVPGIADQAKFTTAGTYGVTLAEDVTNRLATVGASGGATVTFDLAGHTWQMTNNLAFANTGTARFSGGRLRVGYDNQTNTTSTVTVWASQRVVLTNNATDFMGNLNTETGGAIEALGNDTIVSWAVNLKAAPAGAPSLRLTAGNFSLTNALEASRLTFNDGAKVSLEGGTFSVRYITDMYGTRASPSVLDIYTNATFIARSGLNVCRTGGGVSIVNVLGGSLLLTNGTLNVVHTRYQPSLNVTTGIVNLVDGQIYVGSLVLGKATSNTVGILRQSGGKLTVTGDFYLGGDPEVKPRSQGVYIQEAGSAWVNNLYLGGANGATGDVCLAGGALAVAGAAGAVGKVEGSLGRMTQTGGSLIISNSFSVGGAPQARGSYTNAAGSLWLNGLLYVGNSGNALTGALGRVCLAGNSTINSGIYVGSGGADTGELAVAGGSLVCVNGPLRIGSAIGSVGGVEISGGASVFKGLTVGESGRGTMIISGGLLTMTNGVSLLVGNLSNAVGSVTISGGTNMFNGTQITVGQYGSGFMRIEGGYTYTTNRFIVGGGSNGVGRLELSGGILSAPIIDGRDMTLTNGNPGGYSEVLFDGGTLHHSVDNEWWMPGSFVSTFGKATLTDRGAVIDSNGGVLAISQALSNEVGFAGSFTKKGAGKLTLTSWYNAFTGRVTVREGELAVAVSGALSLTGGVVIDPGAILNLASAGAVRGTVTASGSSSRIDGALTLKSGSVLTNGVGATLGGCGVVTGSVVFATGSAYGRDKAAGSGALRVTGDAVIRDGVTVALTGYTPDDLAAGIPLVTAVSSGTIQTSGRLPVTLDGASHSYWWAKAEAGGKTLTARVISFGTLIAVK